MKQLTRSHTPWQTILFCCLLSLFPTQADETSGELEVVARLDQAPGNITVTEDERILISLHQHYSPTLRVAEVIDGSRLVPFPNSEWNDQDRPDAERLDSVLGIQVDTERIVWMLDNGMRSGITPKLVGWDLKNDRLYKTIDLPEPVSLPNSFLNDLAVDRDSDHIYIADPTRGDQPALIVVDIAAGTARRVLESHVSVSPEQVDLVIGQQPALIRRPDGSTFRPRVGVNPIALDTDNEWLYFGPMHGTAMYRIRTADLRNVSLTAEDRGKAVAFFGNKPVSDGSSVNHAGEVYISDIGNHAIGVIQPNGDYVQLFHDPEILKWPDAFSFGPNDWCYTVANQLHLGPVLNAGEDSSKAPYKIIRFRQPEGGVTGR